MVVSSPRNSARPMSLSKREWGGLQAVCQSFGNSPKDWQPGRKGRRLFQTIAKRAVTSRVWRSARPC
jgi:hypothetical protein